MREIKFRAWGTKTKTMYCEAVPVLGTPVGDGRIYVKTNSPLCDGAFIKHGVLMQYTGLKDKNGVEIYEGDIVVSQWGDKQPKEIRQGEYLCYTENGLDWMNGFYWHEGFDDDSQSDIGCEFSRDINGNTDKFKIKGNIYQNPELL